MRIRLHIYVAVLAALLACAQACAAGNPVSYQHVSMQGYPVDVIKINLSDPRILVTPVVAKNFPNSPEKFENIIKREDPIAAINGNFFCKTTYKPVGDLVINGDLVYFGGVGTAMGIAADNKVEFIKVDKDHHINWNKYKAVISCGPRLVEDGAIVLNARAEGFKDPNLFAARNRSAVGLTKDRYLLFVTVNSPVFFSELAAIMEDLGCRDAMNLDGGGSSGLYYRGDMIRRPSTPLPDIIVVQENELVPSVISNAKDKMIQGEKQIDFMSTVAMVMDKDRLLVKGSKDGKVYLIMKMDDPECVDLPQLGAKITSSQNRIIFQIPADKIRDLFKTGK